MEQRYVVEGRWPFPTDMLRHDDASAGTEADARLIDVLSMEHCPDDIDIRRKYQVGLKREIAHRWSVPNYKRWLSFDWRVFSVNGDSDFLDDT